MPPQSSYYNSKKFPFFLKCPWELVMVKPGREPLNSSACPLLKVWRAGSGPQWEDLSTDEQGASLGDSECMLLRGLLLLSLRCFLALHIEEGRGSNMQRNKAESVPRIPLCLLIMFLAMIDKLSWGGKKVTMWALKIHLTPSSVTRGVWPRKGVRGGALSILY